MLVSSCYTCIMIFAWLRHSWLHPSVKWWIRRVVGSMSTVLINIVCHTGWVASTAFPCFWILFLKNMLLVDMFISCNALETYAIIKWWIWFARSISLDHINHHMNHADFHTFHLVAVYPLGKLFCARWLHRQKVLCLD